MDKKQLIVHCVTEHVIKYVLEMRIIKESVLLWIKMEIVKFVNLNAVIFYM
jgi:hypothetical protein